MARMTTDEALERLGSLVASSLTPSPDDQALDVLKDAILTEDARQNLIERHRNAQDRDDAHRQAAEHVAHVLCHVWDELEALNIGNAKTIVNGLIQRGLPNDHGGPVTSYPLFDEQLERLRAQRAR